MTLSRTCRLTLTELFPSEMDDLRSEVAKWYPDTVSIYTVARADDAYGGSAFTSTLLVADVPCMVESGAAHEQTRAMIGKLVGTQLFTITFAPGIAVQVGDYIEITSRDNEQARVQAVMEPESWDIEFSIIVNTEGEHLP